MPPRKPRPADTESSRLSDDALRAQGFVPFLRADHCTDGEVFRLVGYNVEDRNGKQVKVEVQPMAGNDPPSFVLGVRFDSPDYRKLHMALGADWKKWDNALITVSLAEGRQKDGPRFVNVKEVEALGSGR